MSSYWFRTLRQILGSGGTPSITFWRNSAAPLERPIIKHPVKLHNRSGTARWQSHSSTLSPHSCATSLEWSSSCARPNMSTTRYARQHRIPAVQSHGLVRVGGGHWHWPTRLLADIPTALAHHPLTVACDLCVCRRRLLALCSMVRCSFFRDTQWVGS